MNFETGENDSGIEYLGSGKEKRTTKRIDNIKKANSSFCSFIMQFLNI